MLNIDMGFSGPRLPPVTQFARFERWFVTIMRPSPDRAEEASNLGLRRTTALAQKDSPAARFKT